MSSDAPAIPPTRQEVRLARRPDGLVTPDDFTIVDAPMPDLADGEALMRTVYLGMDATVRTWLNRGEGYLPAVEIGEVVRCSGVGRIVASRCDAYAPGDLVISLAGWTDYSICRDDVYTTPLPPDTPMRPMMM